jgi:Cys-tRNA(Pro)/Cys-tRNA(Cys) deacylase
MTPAIAALRRAGVRHEVLEYPHDPRASSYGVEAAEALGVPPAAVFKTLVATTDDGRLVVGCVPVDRQLDLKALAVAAGAKRCEMAEVAAAERATGYVAGGISPFGQKRRLPVVVDASVSALAEIHVSAGRRGLEIRLAPADLLRAAGATTAPIAR